MILPVSLRAKDGIQLNVDFSVLYASNIFTTMIQDLGRDTITGRVIPVETDGETLRKVVSWIQYHLDNPAPDEVHWEVDLGAEEKREIEEMEETLRQWEKELEEFETIQDVEWDEKATELTDDTARRRWEEDWRAKTNDKKRDIRELEKKHITRAKVARDAAYNAELKRYNERRTSIKEWECNFMNIDTTFLFKIVQAANFLETTDLLNSSCKIVADRIKDGNIKTLDGLPAEIQFQIADLLLPHAYLNAAHAGIIPVSTSRIIRAKIWAETYLSDTWFEAARAVGANPILFGKDLNVFQSNGTAAHTQVSVVLASLDWTGDLKYRLPHGTSILDYLRPGRFQDGEYEVEDSKMTINISESRHALDHSSVKNIQRLVKRDGKGRWQTSMIHLLGSPDIHHLVYNVPEPQGDLRRFRVLTKHLNPYSGDPITWLCAEYDSSVNE